MLFPQWGQVGSIETRTPCIHHSTIWPFNLYNRLSAIINPNQKPRRTPLALFITITGTSCILRKANIMNSGFAASHRRWFWCLAPPGGRLWHAALFQEFCHVSGQSRVTFNCHKNLQQTPAGLTSESLAWGPECAVTGLMIAVTCGEIDVSSSFADLTCALMQTGTTSSSIARKKNSEPRNDGHTRKQCYFFLMIL